MYIYHCASKQELWPVVFCFASHFRKVQPYWFSPRYNWSTEKVGSWFNWHLCHTQASFVCQAEDSTDATGAVWWWPLFYLILHYFAVSFLPPPPPPPPTQTNMMVAIFDLILNYFAVSYRGMFWNQYTVATFDLILNYFAISPPPPPPFTPCQSVIYYSQVRNSPATLEAIYVGNKMNAYVVITRVMLLWSHTYFGSLRVEGVWFSKLSIIYCTHSKLSYCTHSKSITRLEHHYSTHQFINLMYTQREYY